jgi:hypothetical protein
MLRQVESQMGTTPKALRDRPSLAPHLRPLLEAFYEVSAGRSFEDGFAGRTPQPIQQGEILSWFKTWGIDEVVERERYQLAIRRLDRAYLQEMAKKQAAQNDAPKPKL